MRSLKKGTLMLGTAVALMATAGCGDLDVTNPNNPDVERVLSTPGDIVSLAGSTYSTWFNTAQGMDAGGPLNTMADAYTASWNNYFMRLHSSEPRTHYRNDPAASERITVEWYWYNYYATLSSANDALKSIRTRELNWDSDEQKAMAEAISVLMQGLSLAELALNYDKAFVVTDSTDVSTVDFSPRAEVRDAAIGKLDEAIALLEASDFTTEASWMGRTYTSAQLAQVANTAAARALAYFARTSAENATTDWARVASYASKGISMPGSTFDWIFVGDGNCPDLNGTMGICDAIKLWSEPTTMRVDTRIAKMLDPATQQHPFPDPSANPQPNSPDKRLGNGSFGPPAWATSFGARPADGNGGTDFVWTEDNYFPPARGMYHQSNIGHVRYVTYSWFDPNGSSGGLGPVPVMTRQENDLLWAEGLIRSNQNLALAAQLINNSRVGRGQLTPVTAASGVGTINATPGMVGTGLLGALQYEQDIELLGISVVPYYNRRRIDGLQPMTPREMPVPAKELGVLREELYTFGGSFDDHSSGGTFMRVGGVKNVRQIAEAMQTRSRGALRQ